MPVVRATPAEQPTMCLSGAAGAVGERGQGHGCLCGGGDGVGDAGLFAGVKDVCERAIKNRDNPASAVLMNDGGRYLLIGCFFGRNMKVAI